MAFLAHHEPITPPPYGKAKASPDAPIEELPWLGGVPVFSLWFVLLYLAQRLLAINDSLVGLIHDISEIPVSEDWTRDPIPPPVQRIIFEKMKVMEPEFKILGLRFTWEGVIRFLDSLDTVMRREAINSVGGLRERFYDELNGIRFLYLDAAKLKFYDQRAPFGEVVAKKFPSAEYDIQEAANCFALGRYTACVMHSMRVLEAGLDALAKALKVRRSIRGWGTDLYMFNTAWEKELKSKPNLTGWKRQFFPQSFVEFRHFANAWRNHALHTNVQYGESEAFKVCGHVQTFMQHLATRLSEGKRR
jgi:hypothetical protein